MKAPAINPVYLSDYPHASTQGRQAVAGRQELQSKYIYLFTIRTKQPLSKTLSNHRCLWKTYISFSHRKIYYSIVPLLLFGIVLSGYMKIIIILSFLVTR